ncbi:amidohydrolase family protein [Thermogladius sp. 4427co]|uniref:amidohydrolase family protein n=1 Tax=Thermogladius sp. 4427co TaxID=3450718 RepID=UPI003F78C8F0
MIYGIRGNVLTLDDKDRFLRDHVVLVDSDRGVVIDIVPYDKSSEYRPEFIIGSPRHLVTPGLVNTHTHIPMYIFKNVKIEKTGFEWLETVWRMESCLKPRHVYYGSIAGIIELVENGVTLFGDMYFFEEEVARAARELGVRASLSLGVIELFEGPPKHSIEESIGFAIKYSRDELVRGNIGVHSLYSVSPESIERAVAESESKGLIIHIHFAESLDEVRYLREKFGKTPTEVARDLGLLRVRPLLAHSVYIWDSDLPVLSQYKPYISYCPFTIMSWGSGIARVIEFLENQIPVTIGTDGPLTAGVMSTLFEIKVGLAAQGSRYGKPIPFNVYNLLKSSIVEGRRALGWNPIGLVKGGDADLVLWSTPPWLDPMDAVASDIAMSMVYDFQFFKPVYVVVRGRIVNKSPRFITYKNIIYEKIREIREDLSECGVR